MTETHRLSAEGLTLAYGDRMVEEARDRIEAVAELGSRHIGGRPASGSPRGSGESVLGFLS